MGQSKQQIQKWIIIQFYLPIIISLSKYVLWERERKDLVRITVNEYKEISAIKPFSKKK